MTARRRIVARVVPRARGAEGGINVTPLVDVVLVLLVIFMVVTPLREEALRVGLPEERRAPAAPRPPLVVAVLPDGALALDGAAVADRDLEARVAAELRDRAASDRVVLFAAADAAPYPRLVLALDAARRAGAERLALADPSPAPPPATGSPSPP